MATNNTAMPSVSAAPPPSQSPNSPPPSSAAPPPSSAAPPPSNTPAPAPSSNPPASSPPKSSAAPPPGSTQVVTAPSAAPTATEVQTSIILITPSPTRPGESVVVITSVITAPVAPRPTGVATDATGSARPTSADPDALTNAKNETHGLSTGGKTAIAVVIPVVVVALLVLGALFFWRKRKQRKSNEDERRKEVEEYGFNPNHDPTLPAVGMAMAEDESGYRGWGNTNTSSKGKASTTLTSGMTYSDSNSNPGGYANPNSPTHGTYSDATSNDPLMNGRRETLDSDGIAALGAAPYASQQAAGVRRGPSNASSSYSAAAHSDNSGEYPGMPNSNQQEYYQNDAQGYYQQNPYGSHDPYAGSGAAGAGQQPVIKDVSARRNTRIENPKVFPGQGNSGISQNF